MFSCGTKFSNDRLEIVENQYNIILLQLQFKKSFFFESE